MNPEHLHLALNHFPIIGLACASVPLFLGILKNSKIAIISGLCLALVSGWLTFAVMETGENASERYETAPISNYLDGNFGHYLDIHEDRAEKGSKIMYAAAVLATLSLILVLRNIPAGRWVSIAVLMFCLLSAAAGIWIADAGGKIRRPDFRSPPIALPQK